MTFVAKMRFCLYGYKFDKYWSWICPSMSFEAKHDICTYLVLNSVNKRYWDHPCRENEILVYMVGNLINKKVEYGPWFKTWFVNIFCFVFGKLKGFGMFLVAKHDVCTYLVLNSVNKRYWDDPCRETWYLYLYCCKFDKWEGWICPVIYNMIYEPICFVFGKMKLFGNLNLFVVLYHIVPA